MNQGNIARTGGYRTVAHTQEVNDHPAVGHTQDDNHNPAPVHQHWLSRNRLIAANGIFTVYATALAIDTGHADRTWAIWAAVAYGVTTATLWLTRRSSIPVIVRCSCRWPGRWPRR